MSKIIIHRKKDWTTILGYTSLSEVLLDKKRIGTVSGGETNEFEVSPGQHQLKIKMGRFGSRAYNFTLYNNEIRSFIVTSLKSSITVASILFIILIEFLHRVSKVHLSRDIIQLIIVVIILLYVIFQIFGRNYYLFIKEKGKL